MILCVREPVDFLRRQRASIMGKTRQQVLADCSLNNCEYRKHTCDHKFWTGDNRKHTWALRKGKQASLPCYYPKLTHHWGVSKLQFIGNMGKDTDDGSPLQARTVHLRGLRQPECARQKTKQTAQAPAPKTWEELHLPCVKQCANRQAVRDSPCSHRQGPSRKRGKLAAAAAAAISQTLLSSPWMKEGMKHQLPEAAVSVWPQQYSIRPPTIKGARDTGNYLTC